MKHFLTLATILTGGLVLPLSAQMVCSPGSNTLQIRADGNTELVGDIVLICTGGTPITTPNLVVPATNIRIFLNTYISGKVTTTTPGGEVFTEALLLVDEPNHSGASNPLLNCGQIGAPDNGPSGPGVCTTVSTGNPSQTYDGTLCLTSTYGCGRPNVYQGRMPPVFGSPNEVDFLGIPVDAPPAGGTRILRFTNLRADAALLGAPANPANPNLITASIALDGTTMVFPGGFTSASVTIGMIGSNGLAPVTSPAPAVLRVTEAFTSSLKDRNVAFTIANATFAATHYVYSPGAAAYPAQAAQNVPAVIYNSEDGFQWQNNGADGPPNPNPPLGFGSNGPALGGGSPLNTGAFNTNSGMATAGVSSAGTRLAVTFVTKAPSLTVPSVVYLYPVGSPAGTPASGVMVLTSADAAGTGPFNPAASTNLHKGGTVFYEVLYADPFQMEYADFNIAISPNHFNAEVTVTLAPFYTGSSAGFPTPTAANPTPTAIPRFSPVGGSTVTVLGK
jgi:hypothetical protein